MATRYGHHPAVVGWQIDNEVGPPSFDREAVAAWHAFLKTRYGTIDELKRCWTTENWSQHYNDFDQVTLHDTCQQNPGLLLDSLNFTTAVLNYYLRNSGRQTNRPTTSR